MLHHTSSSSVNFPDIIIHKIPALGSLYNYWQPATNQCSRACSDQLHSAPITTTYSVQEYKPRNWCLWSDGSPTYRYRLACTFKSSLISPLIDLPMWSDVSLANSDLLRKLVVQLVSTSRYTSSHIRTSLRSVIDFYSAKWGDSGWRGRNTDGGRHKGDQTGDETEAT